MRFVFCSVCVGYVAFSKIISLPLFTCKNWKPPKQLLEILARFVPLDFKSEPQAVKFCIKALRQQEGDHVRSILQMKKVQLPKTKFVQKAT